MPATLDMPEVAGKINEHFAANPLEDGTAVTATAGESEPAADGPPAKDPLPVPTADELRAAHYAEIIAESQRVEKMRLDYEESNVETKRLKKELEGGQALFLRLTRRDPLQRTLLNATADPNLDNHSDAPLPANDEWRKLPISALDIADHIVGKLDNNHIATLGDLQDHWKAGKRLCDFKGIGEAADTAVVDAFSEYGAQHPEVFGEPVTQAEAEDAAEEAVAE